MSQLTENFSFKKSLGQNFITDTNLLSAIVSDAQVLPSDTVVEIGAGAGSLTFALSQKAKKVYSFEIDRSLQPILDEKLSNCSNVEVIFADVMKYGVDKLEQMVEGRYKVVANLPYYITTPIIMMFLEQASRVDSLTIMVQKEVAVRLNATHNNKDYGAVTVAVQGVADVTVTREVSRRLFYPMPNVDSSVVRIDMRPNKFAIDSREVFRDTVRSCFAMRRKTLVNNLCASFNIDRTTACNLLETLAVDEKVRGEALSVAQIVQLSNLISSKLNRE